ncbi:divalent-cation tolerance protein CutA [Inquilinus limosus]|uniref:divalent-cation tolerance protein CutA n=1 Tax=Inquilinus limosus TaxID=171674 RepID=UPI003F14BE10
MAVVFAYVTTGSEAEAARIGRALVEERLAASVNILPGARSIYRWRGRVEEAAEAVLIAKTRADRFTDLSARVRELHSYELPCIVALRIEGGNAGYLDWIRHESLPCPAPDAAGGG